MRLVGEAAGRGHLDRHDRFREQVPGAIQAAIALVDRVVRWASMTSATVRRCAAAGVPAGSTRRKLCAAWLRTRKADPIASRLG